MHSNTIHSSVALSFSSFTKRTDTYKKTRIFNLNLQTQWEFVYSTIAAVFSVSMYRKPFVMEGNATEVTMFHRLLVSIVVGMPLFYLQVYFGQYTKLGGSDIEVLTPISRGLNITLMLSVFLRLIDMGITQTDLLIYCLLSTKSNLPWNQCPENAKNTCWSPIGFSNCTNCLVKNKVFLSSFHFWKYVYKNNANLDPSWIGVSLPSWNKVIALLLGWIGMIVIMVNFLTYYKKILKYNLILALIFLSTLVIMCFIANGAKLGFSLMFQLDYHTFLNQISWGKAIGDVCDYIGMGRAIHLSHGYIFTYDTPTDFISTLCLFLNFFMVLFGFIVAAATGGIIAYYGDITGNNLKLIFPEDYVANLFTSIPVGLGTFSAPQLWSMFFFLICIMTVISNQIVHLLVIEKCIADCFPKMTRYTQYVMFVAIFFAACISLVLISDDLVYLTRFISRQCLRATEVANALFFSVTMCWIYGVSNISDDIHFFGGSQPTYFWKTCWYLLPLFIYIPFQYHTFQQHTPSNLYRHIFYGIYVLFLMPIPIMAIVEMINYAKQNNCAGLFRPTERWGPIDPEERYLRRTFNPRNEIKAKRRNYACLHNCFRKASIVTTFTNQEAKRRPLADR